MNKSQSPFLPHNPGIHASASTRWFRGPAWFQTKKRRRLSTSYSSPLGFLATTNLEPWLSQETEISSRRSLLSNKILFNGRDITESLIIQRNRSRGKKIRAASVSSLSILYPVIPAKSCPRERTLAFRMPLFAPGDLTAVTFGCSYALPASSPCGLFNAGLCLH